MCRKKIYIVSDEPQRCLVDNLDRLCALDYTDILNEARSLLRLPPQNKVDVEYRLHYNEQYSVGENSGSWVEVGAEEGWQLAKEDILLSK